MPELQNKLNKLKQLFISIFNELKVHYQYSKYDSNQSQVSVNTIISLTSYLPRFKKLSITLKSLIIQKVRAQKICLWVTEEDKENLPNDVIALVNDGLVEVHVCENLGPGKKILPALVKYSEFDIVTADDDIYYPFDWFHELVKLRNKHPQCIIAHRVHSVRFSKNGELLEYDDWTKEVEKPGCHPNYFATGVGGVLYPSQCFDSEVLKTQNYLDFCRFQDDIWLFFMAKLSGIEIFKSEFNFDIIQWLSTKKFGLNKFNCHGENDTAIKNMESHYGFIGSLNIKTSPKETIDD
jgi:hypothetical protein